MKTITIFTPTFNRAYILPQLYNSLLQQATNDFTWLIVDDGSTDGTEQLVNSWIAEGKIEISYHKQPNGGKMRAHNKGVRLCNTPLFTCVDSDDYLTENAINRILHFWRQNYHNEDNICGMIAYRAMVTNDNTPKVIQRFPSLKYCTMHSLMNEYKHKGETTIVFRTDIIKQYLFPEIEGEKFITEAYIYDQIDQKYQTLLFDQAVVICKYLPDGYTKSRATIYEVAPKGWAMYYNQQSRFWRHEYTFKDKVKSIMYYIIMSQIAGTKNVYKNASDQTMRYFIALILAPYYKLKLTRLFSN